MPAAEITNYFSFPFTCADRVFPLPTAARKKMKEETAEDTAPAAAAAAPATPAAAAANPERRFTGGFFTVETPGSPANTQGQRRAGWVAALGVCSERCFVLTAWGLPVSRLISVIGCELGVAGLYITNSFFEKSGIGSVASGFALDLAFYDC